MENVAELRRFEVLDFPPSRIDILGLIELSVYQYRKENFNLNMLCAVYQHNTAST
jgi:hypothetical protein